MIGQPCGFCCVAPDPCPAKRWIAQGFFRRSFGTRLAQSSRMRILTVISLTAAALLATGCNSTGAGATASSSATTTTTVQQNPGCFPLTQLIAFSGSATVTQTSAIADGSTQGQLGLGVVSGVVNGPNATSYSGSSNDGAISFTSQNPGGISGVNGYVQISDAAYNAALSQLGNSNLCVQSMTFDLEVTDQTLFGGQVVLTVNGTQIQLAF